MAVHYDGNWRVLIPTVMDIAAITGRKFYQGLGAGSWLLSALIRSVAVETCYLRSPITDVLESRKQSDEFPKFYMFMGYTEHRNKSWLLQPKKYHIPSLLILKACFTPHKYYNIINAYMYCAIWNYQHIDHFIPLHIQH